MMPYLWIVLASTSFLAIGFGLGILTCAFYLRRLAQEWKGASINKNVVRVSGGEYYLLTFPEYMITKSNELFLKAILDNQEKMRRDDGF